MEPLFLCIVVITSVNGKEKAGGRTEETRGGEKAPGGRGYHHQHRQLHLDHRVPHAPR